jgi:hypothetical protein
MTGIWNQEWLNMNSQRAYPLAEDATRLDESGTFLLPDDFLLELYLPVHAGLDVRPDRFFVRSVAVYPTGCNVAIGYDADELRVVASAVIARTSHREYDSYALPGSGDFDDTLGKVVIGRFDSIDAQPSGQLDHGGQRRRAFAATLRRFRVHRRHEYTNLGGKRRHRQSDPLGRNRRRRPDRDVCLRGRTRATNPYD